MEKINNLNIACFKPLITPKALKKQLPQTQKIAHSVAQNRKIIQHILRNRDKRRMVIAGPCSLHDFDASMDYAQRLAKLQKKVSDNLLLVMRAYFEKPRTTLGWKGMVYDPYLDSSYDIEEGFRRARKILISIAETGLPTATEFLDPIVPQYLADLISWAAVGARTTESQIHRQMASGLSMPVGFKNSINGNISTAIDSIKAASSPHAFTGVDENGQVVIAETRGNKLCHLVMRGGSDGPNYKSEFIAFAKVLLKKANIQNGIIIDCSHDNSAKDHKRQPEVLLDVADQMKGGNHLIAAVMLESFIEQGNQRFSESGKLKYGLSITDKCISWEETEELIKKLNKELGS